MNFSKPFDNFFRDGQGKVVIWQRPNTTLWTWFVSMILSNILPDGQLNFVAELVSFSALFIWAWLEIASGANYFRRTLGVIVLALTITSRLS